MPITNSSKPDTGIPQTELNVGGGFNLLVGGVYRLIVGAAGIGGLINTAKVLGYETWNTITTTWATESRTWDGTITTWTGTSKPSNSITNTSKPA